MESMKHLVASISLCYISFWTPTTILPAAHWPQSHLNILDGVRKKCASLLECWTIRDAGCSLACSLFSWIESTEKVSIGIKLYCLGRGVTGKINYSSYPLQCTHSQIVFLFNNVLELLYWTPRLPQRNSCLWVILKIIVIWQGDCGKLLYYHFD